MNVIFSYDHGLGAVTNTVKASTHKHWMLQLFLSAGGPLDIAVAGSRVDCAGIVVDMDAVHAFSALGRAHITMLINPVSLLGRQLHSRWINGRLYYVLPQRLAQALQFGLNELIGSLSQDTLGVFVAEIQRYFNTGVTAVPFDERVEGVIRHIDACGCDEKHRLDQLAAAACLSPSRLAHLFKEETGVPLKSYMVLHELQKAYAVLAAGGSVTDAAMAAGFDSPSHFAYTNRNMTGMSASGIIKNSEFLKVTIPAEW